MSIETVSDGVAEPCQPDMDHGPVAPATNIFGDQGAVKAMADADKKPTRMRKALIILGMHRSGTSALSHLITELGADAPAHLMAPDANNPKGYFESMPLYLLHDELLANAGSSWDDYRPIPEGWNASPKADEFHQRLKEAVEAEYGRSGFFVVKDPRICRLVPFWRRLLDDMEIEPLFVHTHRHPVEVATSLNKRDGFDLEYGYLMWLRHVLDAETGSRGHKRSFTSYDRILGDWPAQMTKTGADLSISWPRYSSSYASELNSAIEPGLKRNSLGQGGLGGHQMLPDWIETVYRILERWAAKGENAGDWSRLDAVRAAFDDSVAAFHAIVHKNGDSLMAERDAMAARYQADQQALAQAGSERDLLGHQLDEIRYALDEAEAQRLAVAGQLEMEQARAQALQADIAAMAAAYDQISKAHVQGETHRSEQEATIIALTAERDAVRRHITEAQAREAAQADAIASLTVERDAASRASQSQAMGRLQHKPGKSLPLHPTPTARKIADRIKAAPSRFRK